MNLLDTVGRTEGLQPKLLNGWTKALAGVTQRAIAEGDVSERCDPEDVGRLIVSMYVGLRQTSDLDEPERFLLDLEKCWALYLDGNPATRPDRFLQAVRRTAHGTRDPRFVGRGALGLTRASSGTGMRAGLLRLSG